MTNNKSCAALAEDAMVEFEVVRVVVVVNCYINDLRQKAHIVLLAPYSMLKDKGTYIELHATYINAYSQYCSTEYSNNL